MVRFLSISAIALFSLAQLAQTAPTSNYGLGSADIASMEWNNVPAVANMMESSQVNLVKRAHHKNKKHEDDEDSDDEDSDDEDSDDEDSDGEDSDDEDSDDEDEKPKGHKKGPTKKGPTKKSGPKEVKNPFPHVSASFDHMIRGLFDSVVDHIIEITPLHDIVEGNYDFLYEIFTTKVHEIVEDLAAHPINLQNPLEGLDPLELLKGPMEALAQDIDGLDLVNKILNPGEH